MCLCAKRWMNFDSLRLGIRHSVALQFRLVFQTLPNPCRIYICNFICIYGDCNFIINNLFQTGKHLCFFPWSTCFVAFFFVCFQLLTLSIEILGE